MIKTLVPLNPESSADNPFVIDDDPEPHAPQPNTTDKRSDDFDDEEDLQDEGARPPRRV